MTKSKARRVSNFKVSNKRQLESILRGNPPLIDIQVPISFLHRALAKAIQHGYITFSIDVFEDRGVAALCAMNEKYHRGES